MTRRRPTCVQSGFTLIEMMVATTILAITATALAGAIGAARDARSRGHERADRRALLRAVLDRIAADVVAVVPAGGLYATGLTSQDLLGGDGSSSDELILSFMPQA